MQTTETPSYAPVRPSWVTIHRLEHPDGQKGPWTYYVPGTTTPYERQRYTVADRRHLHCPGSEMPGPYDVGLEAPYGWRFGFLSPAPLAHYFRGYLLSLAATGFRYRIYEAPARDVQFSKHSRDFYRYSADDNDMPPPDPDGQVTFDIQHARIRQDLHPKHVCPHLLPAI